MERTIIHGLSVDLYTLADNLVDQYLQSFSPLIQSILHVQDLKHEQEYLEDALQKTSKPFFYLIAHKDNQTIVGSIEIRDPGYRCQIYCWINEQYWGQGFFQEAMKLATHNYFEITDTQSITARVDVDNKRSYHALQKAGFVEIAKARGPHGLQYEMILCRNVKE